MYTSRRKTKQKRNTICARHHYTQTNANNVNKIWALLQITGSKLKTNLPSFLCEIVTDICITIWNSPVKTHNRTTQKTKNMSNIDPPLPINRGWTQMLAMDKQSMLLISHPPCYSYLQSNPVKTLAVIEERKHLRKKSKIHCHLSYGYFETVNQIVMTTARSNLLAMASI